MAKETVFNGKLISIPGSYAKTEAAVNNPPADLSYGRVLIVDDSNSIFGGGSGVDGENHQDKKSIYEFDNIADFRNFVRGGVNFDIAKPLFRPFGTGTQGISRILYIRALQTTGATLSVTWTGGGSNGGILDFKSKHEGLCGNGVEGDEVKAYGELEITNVGAASNEISITANGNTIITWLSDGAMSTNAAANAIAAEINANTYLQSAHGYSAIANGNRVRVFAPDNTGTTANTYTFAVASTGTAAASVLTGANMTGGVNGETLTRGIGMTMEVSPNDANLFIVKFWRGTFTGTDEFGLVYDSKSEKDVKPTLLAQSPEFNNVDDLVAWCNTDIDFRSHLKLTSTLVNGDGSVDAADVSNTAGNQLFSGGTQSHSNVEMASALEAVADRDFSHIISLKSGDDATSANNGLLWDHINNQARYEKFLWIGGGFDRNEFESMTIAACEFFNDERVHVVHGGVEEPIAGETGLREKGSLYKTAYALGRTCGLEPQTPVTLKKLGFAGEVHELKQPEIELGLKKGVFMTQYDSEIGSYVVIMGINTLQTNSNVINSDATSYLLSINRIKAQLNKELQINTKRQLLGNQTQGPNIATLSPAIVENYTKNYLKRKTATATEDNLIISYESVIVNQDQDALKISYGFKANVEINKMFITSIILDPNV